MQKVSYIKVAFYLVVLLSVSLTHPVLHIPELNGIKKFFPFQLCLYIKDLLCGEANIVITSNEVIKFCWVTNVPHRGLSETWKVIKLVKGPPELVDWWYISSVVSRQANIFL